MLETVELSETCHAGPHVDRFPYKVVIVSMALFRSCAADYVEDS